MQALKLVAAAVCLAFLVMVTPVVLVDLFDPFYPNNTASVICYGVLFLMTVALVNAAIATFRKPKSLPDTAPRR